MTLLSLLRIVRTQWVLVIVCLVLGISAGLMLFATRPTTYTAQGALVINPNKPEAGMDAGQINATIVSRMDTYYNLVSTAAVMDPVIKELNLDERPEDVTKRLTVDVPTGSTIIRITASDPSPGSAAALANATLRSLGSTIEAVTPPQSRGSDAIKIVILQDASQAVTEKAGDVTLGGTIGGAAGLAVGLLIGFLRQKSWESGSAPQASGSARAHEVTT